MNQEQRERIWNAERMYDLLEESVELLGSMENEWEEGVLTDEIENSVLDLRDQLSDLLNEIKYRICDIEAEIEKEIENETENPE